MTEIDEAARRVASDIREGSRPDPDDMLALLPMLDATGGAGRGDTWAEWERLRDAYGEAEYSSCGARFAEFEGDGSDEEADIARTALDAFVRRLIIALADREAAERVPADTWARFSELTDMTLESYASLIMAARHDPSGPGYTTYVEGVEKDHDSNREALDTFVRGLIARSEAGGGVAGLDDIDRRAAEIEASAAERRAKFRAANREPTKRFKL